MVAVLQVNLVVNTCSLHLAEKHCGRSINAVLVLKLTVMSVIIMVLIV